MIATKRQFADRTLGHKVPSPQNRPQASYRFLCQFFQIVFHHELTVQENTILFPSIRKFSYVKCIKDLNTLFSIRMSTLSKFFKYNRTTRIEQCKYQIKFLINVQKYSSSLLIIIEHKCYPINQTRLTYKNTVTPAEYGKSMTTQNL